MRRLPPGAVAVALLLLLVTAAAPAMGLEPAASRYSIELFSVNAGGSAGMSGSLYTLGVTAGQPAAGQLAGAVYNAQIGFWGGAAIEACPVILTGDADQSSEIKLSDVILLVNYVLKAGAVPVPCAAAGDVNCDGAVKLSDVIGLVNYVLKAGTPPCDVCTLIPGNWTCP